MKKVSAVILTDEEAARIHPQKKGSVERLKLVSDYIMRVAPILLSGLAVLGFAWYALTKSRIALAILQGCILAFIIYTIARQVTK